MGKQSFLLKNDVLLFLLAKKFLNMKTLFQTDSNISQQTLQRNPVALSASSNTKTHFRYPLPRDVEWFIL